MMLLVQCPSCKHQMKYESRRQELGSKKCVFCGRTFKVSRDSIIKKTTPTEPIKPLFLGRSRE